MIFFGREFQTLPHPYIGLKSDLMVRVLTNNKTSELQVP